MLWLVETYEQWEITGEVDDLACSRTIPQSDSEYLMRGTQTEHPFHKEKGAMTCVMRECNQTWKWDIG